MRRCGACFLLVSTDDHLCPRCGEEVETELEKLNDALELYTLADISNEYERTL